MCTQVFMKMVFICNLALAAGSALAQPSITLSSGSGAPGTSVSVNISFNGSSTQPTGAQWALNYSTVDFSLVSVTQTSAVSSISGETFLCPAGDGSASCIIINIGSDTVLVPNGIIAVATFRISPSTTSTSSAITLSNLTASDGGGHNLGLTGSGTIITITHPGVAAAALWKLDEPSGASSFSDASGNGNTGSCGAACPSTGMPGKTGTAASFNGIDDQIIIPDSPSLRLNEFTITLWVYPTQVKGDYQPLLVKEDSSGNNRNYGLYIVPNTMQVRYAVWASDCVTRFASNSVGQLALNHWNQIAFTYDGLVETLYLNGVPDSSHTAVTTSLCQSAVPVKIGMETSAFQPFDGTLADIQIDTQSLTAAGVANLYDPPAAMWKLDEPSGASSFSDGSGSGNTGSCGAACPTMGVPGRTGTAAGFNGINDQIIIPDSPSLRLNQFTITLWVYPTQVKGDYQPLLVKEDWSGNSRNYGLYIAPNTMHVRYAVWAGDCTTRFATNSVGQLALNHWTQITFTYDGLVETLYLNGVPDSSYTAVTSSLCQSAVPVKIGMETSAVQPFEGTVADIQIDTQPLTAAGVANLYNPPAALWRLDEPSGTSSFGDGSGSGNTGSCGATCPTMGVPGRTGTAAGFNGINDQIVIPDSPSLRLNQFTITLWVYPTQVKGDYQPLLVKEDSSGNNRNYGLYIAPNNMQVRYAVWAGDCATKLAANSVGHLDLNTWTQITFTYDGFVETLYLNGVPDSSQTAVTTLLCQSAVPVKIGMETSAFQPFEGTLAGIQIDTQPLTAAGVANLYSANSFGSQVESETGGASPTE